MVPDGNVLLTTTKDQEETTDVVRVICNRDYRTSVHDIAVVGARKGKQVAKDLRMERKNAFIDPRCGGVCDDNTIAVSEPNVCVSIDPVGHGRARGVVN